MKKKIILVAISIFIGIGIGVGASTLFNSNQVLYKNNTTVEQALNDLYVKSNYGDATASDILSGKKALVGGREITGSLAYTSLSGTQSVGAGGSSALLNGLYNMSNYKISCGGYSSCSSCCGSCPACNSCCSGQNAKTGSFAGNQTSDINVYVGFTPSVFVLYRMTSSNLTEPNTYDSRFSTSKVSNGSGTSYAIPNTRTSGTYIKSIGSTVTIWAGNPGTYYWLAIA